MKHHIILKQEWRTLGSKLIIENMREHKSQVYKYRTGTIYTNDFRYYA